MHAPVAIGNDHVYYLSNMTVYSFSPQTNEIVTLFSLTDNSVPIKANRPLIYADGGHLWVVVQEVESNAIVLRRYAPPAATVTSEYSLRAWPEHGAFVNGRFYYIGVDPSVSIQAALYALDLNDGSTYLAEEKSLLGFFHSGDYLYYSPYELYGDSDKTTTSVAFASDPPYPVMRFNTLTGQIDPLAFGVPFPEVRKFGNYIVSLNPADDGTVDCMAYDANSGQAKLITKLTCSTYPTLIANDRYMLIQTADGAGMTFHVYDTALNNIKVKNVSYHAGVVPVAIDNTYVYLVNTSGTAPVSLTAHAYLETDDASSVE